MKQRHGRPRTAHKCSLHHLGLEVAQGEVLSHPQGMSFIEVSLMGTLITQITWQTLNLIGLRSDPRVLQGRGLSWKNMVQQGGLFMGFRI